MAREALCCTGWCWVVFSSLSEACLICRGNLFVCGACIRRACCTISVSLHLLQSRHGRERVMDDQCSPNAPCQSSILTFLQRPAEALSTRYDVERSPRCTCLAKWTSELELAENHEAARDEAGRMKHLLVSRLSRPSSLCVHSVVSQMHGCVVKVDTKSILQFTALVTQRFDLKAVELQDLPKFGDDLTVPEMGIPNGLRIPF